LEAAGIADLLADRHRLAERHQPRQVALDRMHRHAAIGIGCPAEAPRWVRVMSSRRAALRASSWNSS
jgi:hypothetical protein